jgi:hypothetical protein
MFFAYINQDDNKTCNASFIVEAYHCARVRGFALANGATFVHPKSKSWDSTGTNTMISSLIVLSGPRQTLYVSFLHL